MRILLMEDEAAIRSALTRGLTARGHQVEAVASLTDARALLARFSPEALVSDLKLPDGNIMEFRATRKSKFKVSGKDAKLKDLVSGQAAEIDGRYFLGGVDVVTVVVATARPK